MMMMMMMIMITTIVVSMTVMIMTIVGIFVIECHYQLCIIATTTNSLIATRVLRDGGRGETCKMERTDIVYVRIVYIYTSHTHIYIYICRYEMHI